MDGLSILMGGGDGMISQAEFYEAVAEGLARKVECGTPNEVAKVRMHFERLIEIADLRSPETIRRLYPVVAEIVDGMGDDGIGGRLDEILGVPDC